MVPQGHRWTSLSNSIILGVTSDREEATKPSKKFNFILHSFTNVERYKTCIEVKETVGLSFLQYLY